MAKGKPSRRTQLVQAYKVTKRTDRRIGLILLGVFLFAGLVGFSLFFLIPPSLLALDILMGVMIGLLAVLIVFSRRATRAQYSQIEGQPGAAAAALGTLRRGWKLDAAVGFNKSQDVVHRVVGPPGIVLIGEGDSGRLKNLLATERIRHQRVTADTPVHEIIVGYGPGEVPLAKLTRHVTKLGRKIRPAEMTDVLARIKALDAMRSTIPLPKGPIPTNMKGLRGNMRGR